MFKAKDFVSKVQRIITKSEYDHVGIILKYASGRIGILESTASNGVQVVMWDDFIFNNWCQLYSKIVYRQLQTVRSDKMLFEFENFVKEVKGMKYQISAKKLISNKDETNHNLKNGYFCSELVAAAYKSLDLLPSSPPSSKYLPGHFSANKSLPLQNHSKLGNEMLINFNYI